MLRNNWRVCVLLTLACSTGCSGDDGPGLPIDGSGGSSGSGGEPPASTGGSASATGGSATETGGARSTGGSAGVTGGTATATGGFASGTGGSANTGGAATATGGKTNGGGGATGGTNVGTGGKSAGGSATGGSSTGGNTGGANTGGKSTGGANTGGASGAATGGTAGGSACPEVNTQLCGMVAQHNAARANVMPAPTTPLPEMTWNTAAATAAQSWADQCMFSHSAAGYGQNIYASSGSNPPTPKAVVDSWVSEVEDYNYSNNTCSGVCGHYTQVVWRGSIGVGCGIKTCTTNSPFGSGNWTIVVCNYSPPGNVNNQKPY